jgi:hypothetical protein
MFAWGDVLHMWSAVQDLHAEGSGHHGSPGITAAQAARNVNNARAIENGLLWMTVIPMALKFIVYGVMHS